MNNQTVSSYYECDHDRLDDLFKNFQRWKRTDFRLAKQFFRQFKLGLQRHIVWEEEILFPLFEQKTGMHNQGPTEVMRREHRFVKQHLEAIHDKVKEGSPETDSDEALLLNTLSMHNDKEERILYPAIDGSVTDSEREALFQMMSNTPEDRYHHCC